MEGPQCFLYPTTTTTTTSNSNKPEDDQSSSGETTGLVRVLVTSEDLNQLQLAKLPGSPEQAEPESVFQVWTMLTIPSNTSRYAVRTCTGKYLSADKFGQVTAEKEAIGACETWLPLVREDGRLTLQNAQSGWYLGVDEEKWMIRCDYERSNEPNQGWLVKCQTAVREKRLRKGEKQEGGGGGGGEEDGVDQGKALIKKYQSWVSGRHRNAEKEDTEVLLKARREGRLAEALLDKREKTKADRYCK